jgi:uncharacterized protein (UPF0332 family)/predicted nucleotidyltransferase
MQMPAKKDYRKDAPQDTKDSPAPEQKYAKPEPLEKPKEELPGVPPDMLARLPPEAREKLMAIKDKVEKFKSKVLEKFEKYITGIALLPPPRAPEGQPAPPEDKIHLLILVDDTEPSKMSKAELKDKLMAIMDSTAKEVDPNIAPQTVLLSELWQSCYDGKYDLLELIAMGAPVHDTGMLSAIKIAEVHKSMTLKKFEKYIVAYVLAGSLVQGRATKDSDIDVFLVIDDTDVKKMTRTELRDKLRAIIVGMGIEAGEITGVRNKINIQVYILTDFWESIREANPVIFTFLRDGVPFYDRGIFMPWKQLLKMGKIRPSAEAIDLYMSSGEQMLDRVRFKFKDIGMEDIYYAILTPSQAALMMYGVPPPTPKETPEVMRDIFVRKEKLLEDADVDILAETIKVRKDLEHGTRKEVTGKELDQLLANAEKYLKRIRRLFTQIEKQREEESVLQAHETVLTAARDALRVEGVEKASDSELLHVFEERLIATGKLPAKLLRSLHAVMEAKDEYDAGKLGKADVEKARKEANELLRALVDFIQRKRLRDLEQVRIRVRYAGQKLGEVTLLGKEAFILLDAEAGEKQYQKAAVKPDGSLEGLAPATLEELEQALAKLTAPQRAFIKEPTFESLKRVFGKDVEVLVA